MYPVSAAFAAALKANHSIVTLATLKTSSGLLTLPVVGGQVRVDSSASVRRQATISLTDPDGSIIGGDLLGPYGAELRLYRGIRLSTGDELVPLGVYNVSRPKVTDTGDGLTISVDAYDRSRRVDRAGFADTWTVAAGSSPVAAIDALLRDAIPSLPAGNYMSTTATTGRLVYPAGAGGRWQAVSDLAAMMGAVCYFDANGTPTIAPVPTATGSPPVATYAEGVDATLLTVDRDRTDENTYSRVIVIATSSYAPPLRSIADDTNSASPTYVGGSFGIVPRVVRTTAVHTQADCDAMAAAELRKTIGFTEQVNTTSIVNPAHDAGDVIAVARARAGVSGFYVVQTATIPLEADQPLQLGCKLQSVGS